MKKKFLAGLLSLAMMLTLLPVGAFAADAISGTITAEPDTVTAVLSSASADPDFTYTVTLGGYALPDADQAADSTKDVTLTLPQTVDGTTTNYTSTVTLTYKVADDVASWELPADQISFASGDPSTELLKATVAGTVATAAPTEVTAVAVTLTTTGLTVASTLPQATTETVGVNLDTVWKSNNGAEVTEFAEAGTYSAEITVTAADGYKLADNVTYTLNEAEATVTNGVLTATAEVGEATAAPTEVTAVAVTLTTTGLTVASTLPQATTETVGVNLDTVWKSNNGAEVTEFAEAGTYSAEITVTAADGYKLADNVTYTLNEAEATVTNGVLTATAEVGEATAAPTEIKSIAVSVAPDGLTIGEALPDTATVTTDPATTGVVTVKSLAWTKDGTEATGNVTAGTYTATIVLEIAETHTAASDIAYTIDGTTATSTEETITLTKEYTVEASAPKEYNVTVNSEPTIGGTAAANVEKAAEGAEVTVTITPAEGYKVDTVTMGGTVVEDVTDNVFTFTMPAADVLVQVIFVEETTVNAEVSAPEADATGETSVSNDVVAAAIEKAKEDAGVEGNATVGKVEITAGDASRITLDQQAVETLAEAESVTVKAEAGEVTLPKEILNENKTKSLTLVVEEATRPDVAAAVEIKASYEVKVESNGQEVPVSNLSKPIKLRFTIDTNLTGEPTLAYFDTVSKKIKAIASSVYYPNTGVIEGEITHLTQIVVADKADVDDTQEPAVTVKYQIGSNEAVTLTGTSAAVTVDADVENIKITVDGATLVTVNGEAYTSGGNTVALNEGANTITIVADDQTYTLTVTRESATTPEYTELTADNFSFTTTLTDEEKAKFYQGKLTITGLDSGKTYVVTYEHQNATGNTIPRIAHVVENPAGGEIELSCQSTMGVMVFEVIGSNVTSDLTCIFESAKHKGVPVTTFKAS